MEVKGRNLAEGMPRSFTVSSNEILEALTDPLNSIVSAVKTALEQTPPELGADIAERGMVLTGGGALLRDVDRLLMEETGLPVVVADDPLTCVVRGSGKALENMENSTVSSPPTERAHGQQAAASHGIRCRVPFISSSRAGTEASRRRHATRRVAPAVRWRHSSTIPTLRSSIAAVAARSTRVFRPVSLALLFADTRYRYLENVRRWSRRALSAAARGADARRSHGRTSAPISSQRALTADNAH